MNEVMPENRNIKTTSINGKHISTAEIWRNFGVWLSRYETFVWEIDETSKNLGAILYMTYQNTEDEAIRAHDHMVRNFTAEVSE